MTSTLKLVECPRDAWQGLQQQIPTATKVAYLRSLVAAGFKHIDAVSFVSPKAVPQMADSEDVLSKLDPPDDVEIIGIVVNDKGAKRAIDTEAVRTVGFPYSISPTFLQNNQKQTLEDAVEQLEKIKGMADDADLDVVAYISMAFGNPYGDLWNVEEVSEAVGILADMDLKQISLADTVGAADAAKIGDVVREILKRYDHLEIGVHLHSRPESAVEKLLAAYDAGARRFDSAIGGLGGCPFAQDSLVGNISTENVLAALMKRNAEIPLKHSIADAAAISSEIEAQYGH